MSAPRVEIDLIKVQENTRCLVDRIAPRGINVTGVTKAVCSHPYVAWAMLEGGVIGLADARVANVVRMRAAGITCPISLIRTPMQSEADAVVGCCDASFNTENQTIGKLGAAALQCGIVHDVILMVEMGDNRDGILPENIAVFGTQVVEVPGIALKGIAATFACLGDVAPTLADMALLTRLAEDVEGACGPVVARVSGGGCANLSQALTGAPCGRTDDLRLGEAILLGLDPESWRPIDGLHTDAFTLVAEVIETRPVAQMFPAPVIGIARNVRCVVRSGGSRAILALGQQDTDTGGLVFPPDVTFIGATSDHTVISSTRPAPGVGTEKRMAMTYSALMRAMNASGVAKARVQDQP